MTTSVTLPLTPSLATPETPTPALPPDDVFTSLLMALTQAIGMPMPQRGPATHLPDTPAPTSGVSTGPAGPTSSCIAVGPAVGGDTGALAQHPPVAEGAWAVATQRAVLPEAVPPRPELGRVAAKAESHGKTDAPGKADAAPGRTEGPPAGRHGSAVRDLTPAAENAPRPEGAGHAVPAAAQRPEPFPESVTQVVPEVAPPVAAAVATSTTPAPAVAADPGVEQVSSTHQVTPAVVEAARGLRHEGGGRSTLVVRLDPPELGAVLVRLTVQDGRVDVQLRTPDLVARADLQAQSYDVQQVLREQGFDLSSFDVRHGDVLSDERQGAPDRGTREDRRRADGHPAHPHVTDDVPAPTPSGTWL